VFEREVPVRERLAFENDRRTVRVPRSGVDRDHIEQPDKTGESDRHKCTDGEMALPSLACHGRMLVSETLSSRA
jgi:hypothetical protein